MESSVRKFVDMVSTNTAVAEILARADSLDLPDWYLTGGCLFQTVWNVLDGHEPKRGIRDYDLFYFDAADLTWENEDDVIRRSALLFEGCGGQVEVRNEARVHLWYEERFGVAVDPLRNTADAIDSFVATACCVGIRSVGGETSVYAPHGFDDLFGLVLRPNPVRDVPDVYEAKAARWRELWPRLTVLPWHVEGR